MTERTPGAGPGPPARARLRSDAWFTGDDEVAMAHRVAFTSAGLEVSRRGGRPVIGIVLFVGTLVFGVVRQRARDKRQPPAPPQAQSPDGGAPTQP